MELIINQERLNAHALCEKMTGTGLWHYHPDRGMLTCSPNFFSILGFKDGEESVSADTLIKLINDDCREPFIEKIVNALLTNQAADITVHITTQQGQPKILHCRVEETTSNDDGLVYGLIRDVSEESTIQQRLEESTSISELLIENSVDMIAAYNNNLKVIAWNKRCEQLFCMKKQDVLGKHILEIFPRFEGKPIMEQLERVKKGEQIQLKEQKFLHIDGYYESIITPLKNHNEQILGVLMIIHDITDIKNTSIELDQLNQNLVRKNEEFERSNQELASFSYVASHDLQEPLRKIQTFSHRIIEKEEKNLSKEGREYLKRMASACERMQNLIDDLLTFSRTNSSPRVFEATDLNKIVQSICDDHAEKLAETTAQVRFENLPVVKAIPFQFKQMLENLVLNSIKYRKNDVPPEIDISYAKTSLNGHGENGEDHYHELTIRDNGIGFQQEYAEKIFELFQRLHGRHEYPGTGLGLAICKKIIHNHGGYIRAKGKPGEGAVFQVYFPENI